MSDDAGRLARALELALLDQVAHGLDVLPAPPAAARAPAPAPISPETPAAAETPAAPETPVRPETRAPIEAEAPIKPEVAEPTPAPTTAPADPAPSEAIDDDAAVAAELSSLAATVADCRRCVLAKTRRNTVFGEGATSPRLMFVGEGPGADEDRSGRPFVGKAGRLLDKMIEAMTLRREDVYIANIVKCRPPENRAPNPDESQACVGYLYEQIRLLCPEVICPLGSPAARLILESESGITRLRGRTFTFKRDPRIKVIATFHPAYLLRRPEEKAKAWADLQNVMRELGLTRP